MFSKTCEYAIRAVIFVAQRTRDGNRVGIKEIAKGIASPEHFVAKILQDLVRHEVLLSAKGPNGGFYLDDKCLHHTLADIVAVTDGDNIFHECALGLNKCSEEKPCPLHHKFKTIREEIKELMESATIEHFSNEPEWSPSYLKR